MQFDLLISGRIPLARVGISWSDVNCLCQCYRFQPGSCARCLWWLYCLGRNSTSTPIWPHSNVRSGPAILAPLPWKL